MLAVRRPVSKGLILLLQSGFVIDLSSRHLKSFVVLAEELHFGQAANRLGIAQSALSQQIRRLEAAIGVPLFTRTSRHVALTAAGGELRDAAERVLADLDRAASRAQEAANGRIGTVRVGSQGAALNWLVPRTIQLLSKREPRLSVALCHLTSEEQASGLLDDTIDVGFVRSVEPRAGLLLETILEEPVHAVLPVDHPLSGHDKVDLQELAAEPFVLWGRHGSPPFFDELLAACHAAGFSPRVAYEVSGVHARHGFIAAGLGVGLEAASYRQSPHRGVLYIPLAGVPVSARIQLAWRNAREDPRRDLLLDVAREVALNPKRAPRR